MPTDDRSSSVPPQHSVVDALLGYLLHLVSQPAEVSADGIVLVGLEYLAHQQLVLPLAVLPLLLPDAVSSELAASTLQQLSLFGSDAEVPA